MPLTKIQIASLLKKLTTQPRTVKLSVGGLLDHYGAFELCQPSTTQAPIFAVITKQKPLNYLNEISDNQNLHKLYARVPWTLPTEPQPYGTTIELWNQVKECITSHVDLPDSDAYTVLTAWVFASWLQERFLIAPYLFFFGSFATGKTRALEVLSKLSMRGWLALFMTPANLYRPLEVWHPTLFLDEGEIYGDRPEIIGLLNGSYRRGQFVARQVETENGYETEFYDCFGFKAIAGTSELAKTLQSRCIIFRTSQATRKINFFVDEAQCTALRNKLLKWRFDTMLKSEGSGEDEAFRERGEKLVEEVGDARTVELFYPLLSVAPAKEIEKELIEYAKRASQQKTEELSLTTETTCLSAILEAKKRGKLMNGRIYLKDIADIVNESLTLEERWSQRFTGTQCSVLGFQKTRGTAGKTVIKWDNKLIERLQKDKRYTTAFEAATQPSPSQTPSPSPLSSLTGDTKNWKDATR
jgi:hypothetical protein